MPVLTGRLSRANPQSHLQRRKQGWGREKALNLSVSAPLTNCNVATCWHVELSTLNLLLLWLNIYLSNSFNSSIHVFHSKIALDWPWANLGALLAQPQKSNDVQCLPSLPLPVSAGRLSYRQTYIKQVAEKHWCLRSIHMPVMAGRFFKGKPAISINLTFNVENKDEVGGWGLWVCLSLRRWQAAVWPRVGTLNSARSTFSSFDSIFTWAIASILLSTSFIRK